MTNFNEFSSQLYDDMLQIQLLASGRPTEAEQIDRIQYIAMAAMYCLAYRMGHIATGFWLRQMAERVEARAQGDVH